MDDVEYGTASAETYFAANMDNQRRRAAAMNCAGANRDRCEDCGEPIPDERRAAVEKMGMKCALCVACKTQLERMRYR
jgi:RNA polymerase-binding transcription factor DksA